MFTIWKAKLEPKDEQSIEVPWQSEFLSAREQGDDICVWFRCDPRQPCVSRKILIVGTGHKAPDDRNAKYLGQAQLSDGGLVFHIFEVIDG